MKNVIIFAVVATLACAAPAEETVREKKSPAPAVNQPQHDDKQQPNHADARSYGYGIATPTILPVGSYGSIGGGCAYSSPVVQGPSVGVFPNSNIGGCAVPLLLSCSPSVSSGHVIKQYGSSYGGAHSAYRAAEGENQTPEMKAALEQAWAQAASIQQESMRQSGMHQPMQQGQSGPQSLGQTAAFYPQLNYY